MLLEDVMNLGRIFLKGNEEKRGGLKRINRSQTISHDGKTSPSSRCWDRTVILVKETFVFA